MDSILQITNIFKILSLCLTLSFHLKDVGDNGYPLLLDSLIGKKMLFKVDSKVHQSNKYEKSFPVRRVCIDESIIGMFGVDLEITPRKVNL